VDGENLVKVGVGLSEKGTPGGKGKATELCSVAKIEHSQVG
jgi:hypothetical protein